MKLINYILLIPLLLIGCASIHMSTSDKEIRDDYIWIFYGKHKQLTEADKKEATRLLNDYEIKSKIFDNNKNEITYESFLEDETAEYNLIEFMDRIKE